MITTAPSRTRRYLDAISAVGAMTAELIATPWRRRHRLIWGTTQGEAAAIWPGDELVPEPTWQYTHAVEIGVEPPDVWPWLVQVGQGRGGFYSYDALENLFGCQIANTTTIIEEYQSLAVGDGIRFHARAPIIPVAVLNPGADIVLGQASPVGPGAVWGLHLRPTPSGGSRLAIRARFFPGTRLVDRLSFGPTVLEPVGFVMERRMLRAIKTLAESSPPVAPTPTRTMVTSTTDLRP